MKVTLLFITICFFIQFSYAQSIEELAKNNASIFCECIKKIEYIDSEIDFSIKYKSCEPLTKKDSIRLEQQNKRQDYQVFMHDFLYENCPTFNQQRLALRQSLLNERIDSSFKVDSSWDKQLVGEYNLGGSRDPNAGSASLYILKENTFAIFAYATYIPGRWKVVKNKYLHLIPYKTNYPFGIYGRYNPEIGDSTKIVFRGNDLTDGIIIRFGKKTTQNQPYIPILNDDANCLGYPLSKTIEDNFDDITLTYKPYFYDSDNEKKQELDVYTFKKKEYYNDFVIHEYLDIYNRPASHLMIQEDGLMGRQGIITREPLPEEDNEEMRFMEEILNIEVESDTLVINAAHKSFGSDITDLDWYEYNPETNSYWSTEKCEGEGCPTENDYDYDTEIYLYEKLQEVTKNKTVVNTQEEPLLYRTCENYNNN